MIAIVFALPEESRDFRTAVRAVRDGQGNWRAELGGTALLIAHCGVGPAAAARATAALLAAHRPEMLIATGFAGALDPTLAIGELIVATNHTTAALLLRTERAGILVSAPAPVETVAAKAALHAATGASAVDMETASIAATCATAGIPLLALRAISDLATEALPVPFHEWFDLTRQRPRPAALVWYLARHPGRIAPFTRFVRGLGPARRALAAFLTRFILSLR